MNLLWPSRITSTLWSHTQALNAPLSWWVAAHKNCYTSTTWRSIVFLTLRIARWAPWCWERWGIPRSWGSLGTRRSFRCRRTDTRRWIQSPRTRSCDRWPDPPQSGPAVQRSAGQQGIAVHIGWNWSYSFQDDSNIFMIRISKYAQFLFKSHSSNNYFNILVYYLAS